MRRFLPLICTAALLLGACETTRTRLSTKEEADLKIRLVEENKTSLTPAQRGIFLQKRFGTEEEVYEGLDRMIEASRVHDRAAGRRSSSLAELKGIETGPRVHRIR